MSVCGTHFRYHVAPDSTTSFPLTVFYHLSSGKLVLDNVVPSIKLTQYERCLFKSEGSYLERIALKAAQRDIGRRQAYAKRMSRELQLVA